MYKYSQTNIHDPCPGELSKPNSPYASGQEAGAAKQYIGEPESIRFSTTEQFG